MEQIGKDFDIVLKMSAPLDIPKRVPDPFQLSSSATRSFPGSPGRFFQIPSPIITKRTRTHSQSERARSSPLETGKIKYFSRHKGHGYITRDNGESDIFVHVSDIEGEYVPKEGDEVSFRLCPIPPKNERFQAVHVNIIDVQREPHERWDVLPLSGSHCE